jgi:ABC-type Mn2+/Zn2+ transport system ATPase subunit
MMALVSRLASEGRSILIATHDVEQARAWDLVLCLNRRQVAFGPPEETLSLPVLEATYGGAIVMLPADEADRRGPRPAILPPHHHGVH